MQEDRLKVKRYDFLMSKAFANSKKSGFSLGDTLKAWFSFRIWVTKDEFEALLDHEIRHGEMIKTATERGKFQRVIMTSKKRHDI